MSIEDITRELKIKPYKKYGDEITYIFADMLKNTDTWNDVKIEEDERLLDFLNAFNDIKIVNNLPVYDPSKHMQKEFTGFVKNENRQELSLSEDQEFFKYANYAYILNGTTRYIQHHKITAFFKENFVFKISSNLPEFLSRPPEHWAENPEEIDWHTRYAPHVSYKSRQAVFHNDNNTRIYVQLSDEFNGLPPLLNITVNSTKKALFHDGTVGNNTIQLWINPENTSSLIYEDYSKALTEMQKDPYLFNNAKEFLKTFGEFYIDTRSDITHPIGQIYFPNNMLKPKNIDYRNIDSNRIKLSEIIDIIPHYIERK